MKTPAPTPQPVANAELLQQLETSAHRLLIEGKPLLAGLLFASFAVIDTQGRRLDRLMADASAAATDDVDDGEQPPARKRTPRAEGQHRHRFDPQLGRCIVDVGGGELCGKVKGAGGRGNKKPDAAERTQPLPLTAPERAIPSLAAAADKYAGGAHGSSGSSDRRR
jgi:hypothetical protein